MNNQDLGKPNNCEKCEIIPTEMSMPGPLIGFCIWYLWFSATRDGRTDQPPFRQKSAGTILDTEMRQLVALNSVGFEKNPARVAAIDQLTKELKADGWEYIGTGEYWYSKRFRRKL